MASPTIALLDKSSGTGTSASFANATVSGRGQLVVLFLASGHSAINVPSGWTAVPTLSGTSVSVGTIYVYWIRRGGSEPAKTWTWTGSVYWEIYPFEYNGIVGGAGSFVEAVSVGTPTTGLNPDAPSVTTLSTDTLVNALYFQWSGWGGGFMQPPVGYTEITGDSGFDTGLAVKAVGAPAVEDPGVATGAFASDTMWGATFVVASQTAGGPTISAQPSNAHVHVGATASFSVTAAASGGGTLSYQWKKNGSNVVGGSGGTTASYTTPTLTQADDGALYTCDVTETGGSSPGTTPSASATLRVGVIYVAAGTAAYSAASGTSVAPAYPAGLAAGDKLVMLVGQKPSTANGGTVTTPSSPWGLDGSRTGANDGDTGGYTTTLAADTGNCNIFAYSATATGSESGTLTVTVGTNSVSWAQMLLFRAPPGATWSVATTTGKDTSAGNLSITGAADPGVDAGDYVVAGVVIPTDVTTPAQFSAEAFSQTGVGFGTVVEFSEPDSGNGNDIGGVLFGAPVSTGPSSAAPTWTATAGGTTTNVRGPGVFVRLRATSGAGDQSVTPTGIASGEAHGTQTVTRGQVDVAPSSISSAEAFGGARIDQFIGCVAIASLESFGAPALAPGAVSILPAGITSLEQHGAQAVSPGAVTLAPTAVTSAEAHGVQVVSAGGATVLPSAIASAEAHGSTTVAPGSVSLAPSGVATAEVHGSPSMALFVACSGLGSIEAFGAQRIDLALVCSGLPTAEVVGSALIATGSTLAPASIGSAEVVGAATVAPGAVGLTCSGVGTAEAHGSPALGLAVAPTAGGSSEAHGAATVAPGAVGVAPSGVASAEAHGSTALNLAGQLSIAAQAIASGESFGAPALAPGAVVVSPAGIASAQQIGTPTLTLTILAAAIGSGEAAGNPALALQLIAQALASAEAHGAPAVLPGTSSVLPVAVASAEAHGTGLLRLELTPTSVASLEAFGAPQLANGMVIVPGGIASLESVGTAALLPGGITLLPIGIASLEGVGAPFVDALVFVLTGPRDTISFRPETDTIHFARRGLDTMRFR